MDPTLPCICVLSENASVQAPAHRGKLLRTSDMEKRATDCSVQLQVDVSQHAIDRCLVTESVSNG